MNSFIQLNGQDNVVIALRNLQAGEILEVNGEKIALQSDISAGHKVSVKIIPAYGKVIKYGLPIGSATINIIPGQHVHSHNLVSDYQPH